MGVVDTLGQNLLATTNYLPKTSMYSFHDLTCVRQSAGMTVGWKLSTIYILHILQPITKIGENDALHLC